MCARARAREREREREMSGMSGEDYRGKTRSGESSSLYLEIKTLAPRRQKTRAAPARWLFALNGDAGHFYAIKSLLGRHLPRDQRVNEREEKSILPKAEATETLADAQSIADWNPRSTLPAGSMWRLIGEIPEHSAAAVHRSAGACARGPVPIAQGGC